MSQNEKIEEIKSEKKKLEEELLGYEVNSLLESKNDTNKIIHKVFTDKAVEYVKKLANKLSENNKVICLFAIKNKEKANIILSSSKNIENINMGHVFKEFASIINGKGGGSKTLAQGVGDIDKLEEFLNAIVKELS